MTVLYFISFLLVGGFFVVIVGGARKIDDIQLEVIIRFPCI
jgi:hypothetical protein